MPLSTNLPLEMLEHIMKYLLPDDVDNFSTACREFHDIAVRALPRHKARTHDYSSVYFGSFNNSERHPIFLLDDVLRNPDIVWYVKSMNVNLNGIDTDDGDWDAPDRMAAKRKDTIIATVQACPYLDDEERVEWTVKILSLNKITIAALLASMFPSLENIWLLANYWGKCDIHLLVEKVVQAIRLNPSDSHALSKLQCFTEENLPTLIFPEMRSFIPVSGLPSMRRFKGFSLYHDHRWLASAEKSPITSLEFYECMIYVEALESAFSGIANLQDFVYDCCWDWRSKYDYSLYWEREWQPGEIILSLLKFAGHSLVNLDLTRNGKEPCTFGERSLEDKKEVEDEDENESEDDGTHGILRPFMGSLRGFEVLKSIRVQNEMFVEQGAKRIVHRLVDLLPASIVEVSLAKPILNKKDSYRLMEGLPELKAERTPKLERVMCEGFKDMDTAFVFEAEGIELILSENRVMR